MTINNSFLCHMFAEKTVIVEITGMMNIENTLVKRMSNASLLLVEDGI